MPDAPHLTLGELVVEAGGRRLVDGVSLSLAAGEVLALLGASGSGKTLTARSCLGIVEARPGITGGRLEVVDEAGTVHRPLELPAGRRREAAFAGIRGRVVGWLPQEARASLDPLRRVGGQLAEVMALPDAPAGTAEEWLARAGLPEPDRIAARYPHELSGGQAQRVGVALALARGARFLLADEPTTGLDPTVAVRVLARLRTLADTGHGVLLITHDLRHARRIADRVAIMDRGRIVEALPAAGLASATSPAGRALVRATPGFGEVP